MEFVFRGEIYNDYAPIYRIVDGKKELGAPDERQKTYILRAYEDGKSSRLAVFLKAKLLPAGLGEWITEIADTIDQETYNGFTALYNDGLVEGDRQEEYCAYIETLYVMPEYRKCGIASTVLKDLHNFLNWVSDIVLVSAAIIPSITDVTVDDQGWVTTQMKGNPTKKDKEMLKIMKDNLNKSGYQSSETDSGIWIKKYNEGELVIV